MAGVTSRAGCVTIAGVPTPLLVLFYLWVAVSVVILGYRLVARRRSPKAKVVKAADLEPPRPPPSTPATPTATPPTRMVTTPTATPPREADPPPAARPTAGAGPTDDRPVPPPAPAPAGPGTGEGPAASLMEALAGITLPCDLLPMTVVEGRTLGARELLLVTSGYTGAEVGRALGEAVAALGYSVTPLGSDRALAARGRDEITITVHDRPDTILAGRRPAFPTAGADSVVVELRL